MSAPESHILARCVGRAVECALLAYPPDFRRLMASDMAGLVDSELHRVQRARGTVAMLVLGLRVLSGLVWNGIWARLRMSGRPPRFPDRERETVVAAMLNEIQQACRALWRRPGFATVVVLTLALGIGAATAVFSVLHHVVLRPLPFPESERLVQIWETRGDRLEFNFSIPNYESVRERTQAFEEVAAWIFGDFPSVTLTGGDRPERIPGAIVTANLFSVLGVQPALGRAFLPEENEPANAKLVILSHELWSTRFASDTNLLGSALPLNGEEHTVVGIMPPGFEFPIGSGAQVWRPLPYFSSWKDNRGNHLLRVIGRLRDDVRLDAAARQVESLGASLAEEFPEANHDAGMRVVSLHQQIVDGVRPALYALIGAVALVWLVTVANVANLGVARVLDRIPELAVRRALGAGRLKVARVVIIEAGLTAAIGAAVGLLVARFGVRVLAAVGPTEIPRLHTVAVDPVVVGFALALTIVTVAAVGFVSVFATFESALSGALIGCSRRSSQTPGGRRIRSGLVVAEFALALVLVIGAGLLLQSFQNLLGVDPGFSTDGLLTAEVNLAGARYADRASRVHFYEEILPLSKRLPGVVQAGAVTVFPLTGNPGGGTSLHREGASDSDGFVQDVRHRVVTPDYFETIGLPMLSGRAFTADDDSASRRVVIINQALADQLWPAQDPVGKLVISGPPNDPRDAIEVVGLVADLRSGRLDQEPQPHAYFPYPQFAMQEMVLVLRTTGPPGDLAQNLQAVVLSVDPDQPLEAIATVGDIVATSVAQPRFVLLLLGLFALTAVAQSAVGIYGVMTHMVAARTHELGIRMALGADWRNSVGLTLSFGMRHTLLGLGAGAMLALLGTALLESLLFGITAHDPRTFIAGTMLLSIIALIASVVPALRAARVDPARALSAE